MRKVDQKVVQIFFLALMFVMMCMLRLWFAVLLFMAAGIVATLFHRKRSYCGYICPWEPWRNCQARGVGNIWFCQKPFVSRHLFCFSLCFL